MGDIKEYNDQGQLVYNKTPSGHEEWWEYNDQGKLTQFRNSRGVLKNYNDQCQVIYHKDSDGFEEWWTYNAHGQKTYYKNSYYVEDEKDKEDKIQSAIDLLVSIHEDDDSLTEMAKANGFYGGSISRSKANVGTVVRYLMSVRDK